MSIVLYDLADAEGRRFSPNCWRTRMALAHKGLDTDARATLFTDIPGIADGNQKTIPVIEDGGKVVGDSWTIAEYLEDTYADRPSLFGGDAGRSMSHFINGWVDATINAGLAPLIIHDIQTRLDPKDQGYFRESREKRFRKPLEEVQGGRDDNLAAFRRSLYPLRKMLDGQPFIGGESPLYPDYAAFGGFQWARTISDYRVLEEDDPVYAWFERCLDLFDGLGRNEPGYW
ncbi:MAG: glutathione S-transferase family protein [Rhodospirillales bacterium]|nr:glutathione S-transferase family protein [Rhodospirillales bacterium]